MTYRNRISPSGRKTVTAARLVGEMTGKIGVLATVPNANGDAASFRSGGAKLDQIEVELGTAETLHLHLFADTPGTTAVKTPRLLVDLEQWNGTGYDAPAALYNTTADTDQVQAHSQVFTAQHTGVKVRLTAYTAQTSGVAVNPPNVSTANTRSDGVNFRLLALVR